MHPRQASILKSADQLEWKLTAGKRKSGAPVLWKYVDPDSGQDFYLPVRQTTVRSPFSGKSFTSKPEKHQMGDVAKELKQDAKAGK